jgi:hypothetical protein
MNQLLNEGKDSKQAYIFNHKQHSTIVSKARRVSKWSEHEDREAEIGLYGIYSESLGEPSSVPHEKVQSAVGTGCVILLLVLFSYIRHIEKRQVKAGAIPRARHPQLHMLTGLDIPL